MVYAERMKKDRFLPLPSSFVQFPRSSSEFGNRVGCLILSGGNGTRLGGEGPKGCISLPFLKGEPSLFQILCEKIRERGRHIPIAVMTSPLNHRAILKHFCDHHYFGLDRSDLSFFSQSLVPAHEVLRSHDPSPDGRGKRDVGGKSIVCGMPGGNGGAFYHFCRQGIWDRWLCSGVKWVQVLPIDNPLAHPLDSDLLRMHREFGVDLVLRCVHREDAEEEVGVVGHRNGRLSVCEYNELPWEIKYERYQGELKFFLGNSGVFSCSMSWMKRIHDYPLPLHPVHKSGTFCSMGGEGEVPLFRYYETFLLDLFRYADTFRIVLDDRARSFLPIKRRSDLHRLADFYRMRSWDGHNQHTI